MEIIIESEPFEHAGLQKRERYRFEAEMGFRIRISLVELVREHRVVPATKRKKWQIDFHYVRERFGHPVKPKPGVPNHIIERAKDQIYKSAWYDSGITD